MLIYPGKMVSYTVGQKKKNQTGVLLTNYYRFKKKEDGLIHIKSAYPPFKSGYR